MLLAGSPNQHRPRSSSSSLPANVNARFSTMSTAHSLYSHQPLGTNDEPPPLPPSGTAASRESTYGRSRKRSSINSSGESNMLQPRPQSGRVSSDMLINHQYPLPESIAEHDAHTPSTNTSASTIPSVTTSRPTRASTRPSTADSAFGTSHPPTSFSNPPPIPAPKAQRDSQDSFAAPQHQHTRSSSRSSIMSALMSVAPLQTLKIANRTKLDDLDDDEHEMSTKEQHAL